MKFHKTFGWFGNRGKARRGDTTRRGVLRRGARSLRVEPLEERRLLAVLSPGDIVEPNDSIDTATVLGSLPEITLIGIPLQHEQGVDVDVYQITANETGLLSVNTFFAHADGDINIKVTDVNNTTIASSASITDDEQIVIPVIGQQQYFLHVHTIDEATTVYDVEIENFAAPVPSGITLDPGDDSGASALDNVTSVQAPTFLIQADLLEFEAGFGLNPAPHPSGAIDSNGATGADIDVLIQGVNTGTMVSGSATRIGSVGWSFTSPVSLPDDVYEVSARTVIVDGQGTPVTGFSQYSEPLTMVVDTTAPANSGISIGLAPSSDTGVFGDGATSLRQPDFSGLAEAGTKVRIYANNGTSGSILVGEDFAGSDESDGVSDGLGIWAITVEPLADGIYTMRLEVEDLAGNVTNATDIEVIIVDPFELNNTIDTATVLGSVPKITLRDVKLHNIQDVDYFQITANETGKLLINTFFDNSEGDVDISVVDGLGNVIASSTGNGNSEQIAIPVVSQEMYYLQVIATSGQEVIGNVIYDLEIENFAAPVPDAVILDPLHDTGVNNSDNVTFSELSRIFVQADLANFAAAGIEILDPSEVTAGEPGAAVEVLINGVSVGYAMPIAGTNNTLFEFTFSPGELSTTLIAAGGGGGLNFVKAAVHIFDGQLPQVDARAPLSEPLMLTLDMTAPAAPGTPDMLETSDSGAINTDNITTINAPAFQGIAEVNTKVRVFANGLLVGEGRVGSDATDGMIGNGLGHWEVTVEPLKNGQFAITADVEDLAGNISQLSDALVIVVDTEGIDPNDTLATATILGSEPEITLNDMSLHNVDDIDLFKYTAHDTGKLIVNAFTNDEVGLRVRDVNGNIIADGFENVVTPGLNIDMLTIPVVTQQEYFIEVYYNGIAPPEGPVQHVAFYDLEIENFAAPLVDNVDLPAKDQFDVLNDTGLDQFDNVTSRSDVEIILEADLNEFFIEGIQILTAAEAQAGETPGAAVEVFVNGISVGFADPIYDSGHTLFRYTFAAGHLPFVNYDPLASFVADSGGILQYVKGAVLIIDGQQDEEGLPAAAMGRTQLSEPLQLVVDTAAPAASVPNLLASSDSGRYNDDNVTNIATPAFNGTAEHNAIVRIFAVDVTDPANPLPAELVGQGRVGTDLTDGEFDQIGSWEVTVEPLDDHSNGSSPLAHYASYEIYTEIEDLAGNITRLEGDALQIWIDATAPNTPYLDLLGLEALAIPGSEVSDTGRDDTDNVTNDNTPTFSVTADDTPLGNGNSAPNTIIYRIYDRPDPGQLGGAANNGELLLVDSFVTQGGFSSDGFFYNTLPVLPDGVHNLKIEVEDLAGNLSEDFLLSVTIDTVAPPVNIVDIVPAATDTGIENQPGTFIDRITSDTATEFWGWSEANAIVRLHVDPISNDAIDYFGEYSLSVALPEDGNLASPNGQWADAFVRDLNDPRFFPLDGVREILVTAEDLAGNVNYTDDQFGDEGQSIDIFVDTRGPQVDDIYLINDREYDLFDPKPSEDGPTPLVYCLDIDFIDQPVRVDESGIGGSIFVYPAINEILATTPGNYQLIGDANGIIPIESIDFIDYTVAGDIGRTTIRLNFSSPLPDDRFTFTISDGIKDDASNALDGEANTSEPQEAPQFPSGDGEPGGAFTARFTVDSRPEIGVWAAGSVWIDTNGNYTFDPTNNDYTNQDIVYTLAFTSDEVFAGNFTAGAYEAADGFDKLAAYGRTGSTYRWLIDTDNDGVPNFNIIDPSSINGYPVAGNFDGNSTNGDEVGLFTGTTWWLDTNHDFKVDKAIASGIVGYPIVGDFDGDGLDDLATWTDDRFSFDLANNGFGQKDACISEGFAGVAGFIGVRERPVAADMDQDGIDDIGLWVPDRAGATPGESAEWYFLISDDHVWISLGDGLGYAQKRITGTVNTLAHHFTPIPFGKDMYAQFGDEYALPVVGNFDPPVTPTMDNQLPTGTLQLEMTLVRTPTATYANGELTELPESEAQIDEWDSHWIEIWTSCPSAGSTDNVTALFNLNFDAEYFTATRIEYGPAFDQGQTGTIDNASGMVEGLGATASWENIAAGRQVLLARVHLEPSVSGTGVRLTADGNYPQPVDNGVSINAAQAFGAGGASLATVVGAEPDTGIMPVSYDMDDNGQVGLGDLAFFADVYRENVAQSTNPYAAIADFNHDGIVNLGDLAFFASAYRQCLTDSIESPLATSMPEAVLVTESALYDNMSEPDTEDNAAFYASLYEAHLKSVNDSKHSEDEEVTAVDQIMLHYGSNE